MIDPKQSKLASGAPSSGSPPRAKPPEQRRLLLVESLGLAESVVPEFQQRGWHVRTATSVREAIFAAKLEPKLDALVIAFQLPDERGDVAFFRIVAKYPWLRKRVVFVVQNDLEQRVVRQGGYWFVHVPCSAKTIVGAVLAAYSTS